MTGYAGTGQPRRSWVREQLLLGKSAPDYLRSLLTPFNAIALLILLVGIPVAVVRFTQGIGATTNLSDTNPWGLWIGFDVMSGVALAAGGYVIATAVHLFGLKEYKPIVRPAILTGFLGYFFVVVGLLFDLGRPWRLPFPLVVSYGVTSVMFLVAWHVFLYLSCQFLEFCPAVFEWLNWKRLRKWAISLTVAATVAGVMLSTLHQSALGALFLLTPGKLHPLWYSPLLPVFFFASSIVAGLSMVIFESTLSHRIFRGQTEGHKEQMDRITLGLGKAAAVALMAYFGLKIIGVMHSDSWPLLGTPLGTWFLIEIIGFVLIPAFLFAMGVQSRNTTLVRFTAVITVIGIILNRLNVSIIAFNWQVADRYFPNWMEFMITAMIITLGLLTFRWIANRMPVLKEHPAYAEEGHRGGEK